MSNSNDNKIPDEVVADKIINRLVTARLIAEQDRDRAYTQLASGKLKAEDWRLLAEKALGRESREGVHGK